MMMFAAEVIAVVALILCLILACLDEGPGQRNSAVVASIAWGTYVMKMM